LENSEWQDIFLSKTNAVLTWKHVVVAPASKPDGVLSRDTCVSSTQLEEREPIFSLKNLN
jgi:hypothetical protein